MARSKQENIDHHFLHLFEILAHNLKKDDGICYDPSSLFQDSACHDYHWNQFVPLQMEILGTIFKYGGLSDLDRGKNSYIQTAIRFIKSLAINPIEDVHLRKPQQYLFDSSLRWTMLGIGFRFAKILLKIEESMHFGGDPQLLWWLTNDSDFPAVVSNFTHQSRRHNINSGKIYSIRRNIRLNKFQPRIRDSLDYNSRDTCHFNRHLVFDFIIPILDQCPKSDELLAVIKHRTRHALLRYTPRRHLRDAVDRYILRTSGDTES